MVNPLVALLGALLLALILGVLFWPRQGLVQRWQRERRLTKRVRSEDALKHIYQRELEGRHPSMESIAGALHISLNETAALFALMEADQLVQVEQGNIQLTPTGREAALHIIRAHRLWERYLAEETGYTEEAWHEQADYWEHALSHDAADDLSAQLGYPIYDPHGDPIPTASGDIKELKGQSLTKTPADSVARIVHLEDEPEVVYAQLVAEGLHLGQVVRIIESSPERVRFWTNGNEHILAPIVASNISVIPLTRREEVKADEEISGTRLSFLELGESAEVIAISSASRGAERRRLLDLGLVPGTAVTAEVRSPGGDPTAYRIRGSLIALRKKQAEMIKIKKLESTV
jgi:DtxR family transcriptional regulator, Mn-dependent transcriptional regulator